MSEHTKDVARGVIANSKVSISLGHGAREKELQFTVEHLALHMCLPG